MVETVSGGRIARTTVASGYVGRERRRDRRYDRPTLIVEIAGERYRTANWSLGGVLIRGFEGPGRPLSPLFLRLYLAGVEKPWFLEAAVVRFDPARQLLALRFIALDAGAVDSLGRLVTHRLRSGP